ncbi:hypothetical protein BZA05DRAFT_410239 [Tricharina praecox]|uniref:uncharacterized protein n=1 Tax=Tricharina praecox TaxID=43433 RepID=UPI00221FE869|nr:uncharacterized protein BZA05DRAFT_410239 [Tricharina praecox]KAI5844210.1 hypothetical protein BZA05DRAFT_410239 [Tricharina praecox]
MGRKAAQPAPPPIIHPTFSFQICSSTWRRGISSGSSWGRTKSKEGPSGSTFSGSRSKRLLLGPTLKLRRSRWCDRKSRSCLGSCPEQAAGEKTDRATSPHLQAFCSILATRSSLAVSRYPAAAAAWASSTGKAELTTDAASSESRHSSRGYSSNSLEAELENDSAYSWIASRGQISSSSTQDSTEERSSSTLSTFSLRSSSQSQSSSSVRSPLTCALRSISSSSLRSAGLAEGRPELVEGVCDEIEPKVVELSSGFLTGKIEVAPAETTWRTARGLTFAKEVEGGVEGEEEEGEKEGEEEGEEEEETERETGREEEEGEEKGEEEGKEEGETEREEEPDEDEEEEVLRPRVGV